jgi:hypothetical protein
LGDLYVDQFAGSSGDLRFTHLGNVSVATVGMQAAAVIGELWISYDIILKKPRLSPTGSPTIYAKASFGTAVTATQPFSGPGNYSTPSGLNTFLSPSSNINLTFVDGTHVRFPSGVAGTFIIIAAVTCPGGATGSTPNLSITSLPAGVTVLNQFNSNTQSTVLNTAISSSTGVTMGTFIFKTDGTNPFNITLVPGINLGPTGTDLIITEVGL